MRNKVHPKFGPWQSTVVEGAVSLKFYRDGVVFTLRGQGTFELLNHQAGSIALHCRSLSYPLLRTPEEIRVFNREKLLEDA